MLQSFPVDKLVDYSRLIKNKITVRNTIVEGYSHRRYSTCMANEADSLRHNGELPPNRFVIFNFPRTGSNFLCSMLNQHPEILCHHELFNPERIYYAKNFQELFDLGETFTRADLIRGKAGLATIPERDWFPEKFMVQIWKTHFFAKAVGFNLFPTHIPNAASSLVRDSEIKKILLIRKNTLKTYVSLLLARNTATWDLYASTNQQSSDKKIVVNVKRFLRWRSQYEQYFQNLEQKCTTQKQSYLRVYYEDLSGHQGETVKSELLQFIGVSVQPEYLKPTSKKQNSRELKDLIANFDEVEQFL